MLAIRLGYDVNPRSFFPSRRAIRKNVLQCAQRFSFLLLIELESRYTLVLRAVLARRSILREIMYFPMYVLTKKRTGDPFRS